MIGSLFPLWEQHEVLQTCLVIFNKSFQKQVEICEIPFKTFHPTEKETTNIHKTTTNTDNYHNICKSTTNVDKTDRNICRITTNRKKF